MPSGPGVIADDVITAIAATVPPGVASFLLTSKQDVPSIVEQHNQCRTNTLQIVDRLEAGTYQDLRDALPGIALVQVIHVTGEDSLDEALRLAPSVDALLLDSGNQNLAVKELGGTGRRHDWRLSRRIVEAAQDELHTPVYLAGGLKPENIREAIETVHPFGLDLCSGVRTNGHLDEAKLAAFFGAIEQL